MSKTATITKKGQLTIPGDVRRALKSTIVQISMKDGKVVLVPVRSVAGALRKYARRYVPIGEVREKVWKEMAHAKKDSPS